MHDRLLADRERRPGTDRRDQHVARAKEALEAGAHALPFGECGEVLLERDLGCRVEAAEDVFPVLVAPGRVEAGASVRVERLRALDRAEGGIDELRFRERYVDQACARVLERPHSAIEHRAHVRCERNQFEVGAEADDEIAEPAPQLAGDIAEGDIGRRGVRLVRPGNRLEQERGVGGRPRHRARMVE